MGNFGLFYYSPAMAWRATLLIAIALRVTATGIYSAQAATRRCCAKTKVSASCCSS